MERKEVVKLKKMKIILAVAIIVLLPFINVLSVQADEKGPWHSSLKTYVQQE